MAKREDDSFNFCPTFQSTKSCQRSADKKSQAIYFSISFLLRRSEHTLVLISYIWDLLHSFFSLSLWWSPFHDSESDLGLLHSLALLKPFLLAISCPPDRQGQDWGITNVRWAQMQKNKGRCTYNNSYGLSTLEEEEEAFGLQTKTEIAQTVITVRITYTMYTYTVHAVSLKCQEAPEHSWLSVYM